MVVSSRIFRDTENIPVYNANMKCRLSIALVLVGCLSGALAASPSGNVRTINNTSAIPSRTLKRILPKALYNSVADLPIKAWIIVQAKLQEDRVTEARVVKSEANRVYDSAAVQLAKRLRMYSMTAGTNVKYIHAMVHVLIYDLPKGEFAIAFGHQETPLASFYGASDSFTAGYLAPKQ